MHNYDVFVDGEYICTIKGTCLRDAMASADEKFGAYGTVEARYITEQQAWLRAQEWMS